MMQSTTSAWRVHGGNRGHRQNTLKAEIFQASIDSRLRELKNMTCYSL